MQDPRVRVLPLLVVGSVSRCVASLASPATGSAFVAALLALAIIRRGRP